MFKHNKFIGKFDLMTEEQTEKLEPHQSGTDHGAVDKEVGATSVRYRSFSSRQKNLSHISQVQIMEQ